MYKPIEFVIDGLIAQGLYILAGAPKVGKSWLALDMCLSIAKGEKILGLKTSQGTALYLCLEDSYARIQYRLYELTDEPTEMLDPSGRKEVMNVIKKLNKEENITTLHITHYMEEAVQADRVVVVDKGKKLLEGTPKEVFKNVDLLKEIGLDVPYVTELASLLREEGLDLDDDILTVDEMVDKLCQL